MFKLKNWIINLKKNTEEHPIHLVNRSLPIISYLYLWLSFLCFYYLFININIGYSLFIWFCFNIYLHLLIKKNKNNLIKKCDDNFTKDQKFFQYNILFCFLLNSLFVIITSPFFSYELYYFFFVSFCLFFVFWKLRNNSSFFYLLLSIIGFINIYINYFDLLSIYFCFYITLILTFFFFRLLKKKFFNPIKKQNTNNFIENFLNDSGAIEHHFKFDFPFIDVLRMLFIFSLMLFIAFRNYFIFDPKLFNIYVSLLLIFSFTLFLIIYIRTFIINWCNPNVKEILLHHCVSCFAVVTPILAGKFAIDNSLTHPEVRTFYFPFRKQYETWLNGYILEYDCQKQVAKDWKHTYMGSPVPVTSKGIIDSQSMIRSLHYHNHANYQILAKPYLPTNSSLLQKFFFFNKTK